MITISHKIELVPDNRQKSYFRKAFGCARLAYNWGIAERQRRYKEGEKADAYGLRKAFNAIKKEEFPFVLEVTKLLVSGKNFGIWIKNRADYYCKSQP